MFEKTIVLEINETTTKAKTKTRLAKGAVIQLFIEPVRNLKTLVMQIKKL